MVTEGCYQLNPRTAFNHLLWRARQNLLPPSSATLSSPVYHPPLMSCLSMSAHFSSFALFMSRSANFTSASVFDLSMLYLTNTLQSLTVMPIKTSNNVQATELS